MNAGQDPNLERELAEALGSLDVRSLMEIDELRSGGELRPSEGDPSIRRGRVVSIEPGEIFVDLGGKSQGLLTVDKWGHEPLPRVGEVIEVIIEGYDPAEGVLMLSRQGAVRAATWARLREGDIIEVRVTGHNKGGLEVEASGIKGFIPISQVSLERVEADELGRFVHQRLACAVVEIRRSDRTLVVSRREVLRQEEERLRRQTFESLQEGMIVEGKVKTIMPYGAFVDIGGTDGLLHVADMSYARVGDPREVVHEGQQIQVKVLRIDRETRRISLGLKQIEPDPWTDAEIKYRPDTLITGKVVKLAEFGAFVQLEPGVEGLIPISELSYHKRIHHPREIVSEGQEVQVKVMEVDSARRRISLSLKRVEDDPWRGASLRWPANMIVEGVVTRITDFGAFVQLVPGVEGLVHISELSDTRVRSVHTAVHEGEQVKVKILEVDEDRRRISLSIRQARAELALESAAQVPDAAASPPKKRRKPLKGGLEWGGQGMGLQG